MAITKTDFMRGMQCKKMLWLDKHKPNLKVIPLEVQQRLDVYILLPVGMTKRILLSSTM
jgi:hypothetical protein